MATAIGDVAVRVGGDVTDLKQGLAEGSRSVGRFAADSSKHLRKTVNELAKVGAAAAAVAAGGLAAITKSATETGRELRNLSRQANASTSEFQKMAFGASALGIQNDKLADILKDVNDRIGDFVQTGGGPMRDFFEKIGPKVGVTADQFARLSGPQALQLFYTSLEKANLSQADMTFYLEAMASDLTALQPLLQNNGALMQEQARRAERLGLILSEIELAQLDQGAQTFAELGQSIKMAGTLIGANLVPYIDELVQRMGLAAEGMGGMRVAIQTTVNSAIKGFGAVGNVIQGLRVGFKAVELVAVGFGAAIVSAAQLGMEGITWLNDSVNAAVNEIIRALNKIPGVQIGEIGMFTQSEFMQDLRELGNQARDMVGTVRGELHELAMQELPADKINEFLADVAARSQEAAAAVVEARKQMVTMPENMMGGEGVDHQAELDALRERFKSEQEIQMEKYAADLELLRVALENELLVKEEYQLLEQQLAEQHQANLTDIEERAAKARQRVAEMEAAARQRALGGMLSNLSTLMNSESKKQFEIGKKAAISQTVIDTYSGAQKAFTSLADIPYVGPVLGIAAAAAAAAAGFQRVSAIRSQSFGGGGAGATATGSNTAAVNAASTPVGGGQGQPQQIMHLQGLDPSSLYSGSQIQGLVGAINDFVSDGGVLITSG